MIAALSFCMADGLYYTACMAAGLDAALAAAKARETEALVELRRWVEINSYTRNVDGVNQVADRLAASFERLGMMLTRHAGNGVGDHLVWHTAAWERAPGDRVLLIGHHDTVFPPGAFEGWRRDGDRITGPGVLDMKGGLAVIWVALSALADTGQLASLPVAVITVGDEEIGSGDSRPILEQLARDASAALVFESGRAGDEIITRRKGVGSLTLVATGRAAHAGSNHKEGINAIRAAGRFVDAVEAMTDYASEVTVNVGMIRGGEARNTVPASAQCEIDIRFPTADAGRALVDQIHALADRIAHDTGTALAVTGGISRQPLERTDASVALSSAAPKPA
jgi:glutamate carboxypeptidase